MGEADLRLVGGLEDGIAFYFLHITFIVHTQKSNRGPWGSIV